MQNWQCDGLQTDDGEDLVYSMMNSVESINEVDKCQTGHVTIISC